MEKFRRGLALLLCVLLCNSLVLAEERATFRSGLRARLIETIETVAAGNGMEVPKPEKISFSAEKILLCLGDSTVPEVVFDRGRESCAFSVENETIARVSEGKIHGLALGSTTLRAVSESGLRAECELVITNPPTGLLLSHSEAEFLLNISPDLQLIAHPLPDGVGGVRYSSSDPAVAKVNEDGLVTAVSIGECAITAATYDGAHSASCKITVRGILEGVKVGIDPGHQSVPDRRTEPLAPGSSVRKHRTSSGTTGVVTGVREYVINLEIGLKLRDALEAQGAAVYMTRTSHDVTISNVERAEMLNNVGCDLVLRIHCDGAKRHIQGMSILVRKTGAKQEESRQAAKYVLKYMLEETGAVDRGIVETTPG